MRLFTENRPIVTMRRFARREAVSANLPISAAVFDQETVGHDLGKLLEVGGAAADDAAVGHRRSTGQCPEPDLLDRRVFPRVKEAAMGGDDHRFSVQQPAPGERVEEEVDGVDMDEIGIGEMAENLRCQRIAAGAGPGNAHHLDAVDIFAKRQLVFRRGEERIQRDDAHAVTAAHGLAGEIGDHVFQAAAIGQELAHDMDDQRSCFQLRLRDHPICLDDRHFPPIAARAGPR
ncbi:hypothetical protein ACVMH6_005973 [Rhizobium leguminosarum]